MRKNTFILLVSLILVSTTGCKNKPKKSIEELPTKVEVYNQDKYAASNIDSLTLTSIKDFGSGYDSAVYQSDIDSIGHYLKKQTSQEETYHTRSGVVYIIKKYGSGEYPEKGDKIQVQVETKTWDGKVIFSTTRLKQPLQFILGVGQVVPAWDEVFPNVQEGSEFMVIAPSAMNYGTKGIQKILSPNTILLYDIKFEKLISAENKNDKNGPALKMKEEKKEKELELEKIPVSIRKPSH